VIQLVEVALVVFDKGQGLEAVGFVQVELVDAVTLLAEQHVAIPQECGFAEFILFADATAQGVVGVGGGLCRCFVAALLHFDELVLAVVVVAGVQCAACTAALFDQVAARIVGEVAVAVEGQAVACCFGLLAALPAVRA